MSLGYLEPLQMDGFVQGNPKNITERVHQQEKNSTLLLPDIVEVKCPFSTRSMTIKEACSNVKNPDFFLGKLAKKPINLYCMGI